MSLSGEATVARRDLVILFLTAMVSAPLSIVLHEGAHALAVIALGIKLLSVHATHVSFGTGTRTARGIVALAGPAVMLVVVGAATVVATRISRPLVALGVGYAAGLRTALVIAIYAVDRSMAPWVISAPKLDDEYVGSRYLGVPLVLTYGASALILGALWWRMSRTMRSGTKAPSALLIAAGAAVGVLIYLWIFGAHLSL